MSNKKEVADIREEWQFTLRNSDLSHSIPVHGSWLTAAMSQIWDYIALLEKELIALQNERGILEDKLQAKQEQISYLHQDLEYKRDKSGEAET
jgi:predicted  nucleic acid-binding Zn-ribbon protein